VYDWEVGGELTVLPVGEALRRARLSKGWTLGELSYQLRLDKGYLSKVENGQVKNPSLEQTARFAHAFGKTISEFLEEAPSAIGHIGTTETLGNHEEPLYTSPEMTPRAARLAAAMTQATEEMMAAEALSMEDIAAAWRVINTLDRILHRLPEPPAEDQEEAAG
jgi:transcriptional regulator with XRE-family HTH domain